MTAVGRWDVAVLEVVTNGAQWAVITHPDGSEKVFRATWPTKAELDRGEAGIQRLWDSDIGFNDVQHLDGKDLNTLVKFIVGIEATLQATLSGKGRQDVAVSFL